MVLALSLTPDTGIIGAPELAAMSGVVVAGDVARGRHVDTAALMAALTPAPSPVPHSTSPTPSRFPTGTRCGTCHNCIITPHTADTIEMVVPLLAARIRTNVRSPGGRDPLVGLVDAVAGY